MVLRHHRQFIVVKCHFEPSHAVVKRLCRYYGQLNTILDGFTVFFPFSDKTAAVQFLYIFRVVWIHSTLQMLFLLLPSSLVWQLSVRLSRFPCSLHSRFTPSILLLHFIVVIAKIFLAFFVILCLGLTFLWYAFVTYPGTNSLPFPPLFIIMHSLCKIWEVKKGHDFVFEGKKIYASAWVGDSHVPQRCRWDCVSVRRWQGYVLELHVSHQQRGHSRSWCNWNLHYVQKHCTWLVYSLRIALVLEFL